jgi:hypothetical protein
MLGIYLPTYKRPHELQRVASNIEEATSSPFRLIFGLEAEDKEGIKAAKKTGHKVVINKGSRGYSNTIQAIYESDDSPIFFHANDDFFFLPDWDVAPLKKLEENPDIGVLGVHDGNPATNFYTISFVRRSYIEDDSGVIDMPKRVFYPYNHNFIDTEFSHTAIFRGKWDKCPEPCIQHHNPGLLKHFQGVPEKEIDKTYQKNNGTFGIDQETYNSRRHLWS